MFADILLNNEWDNKIFTPINRPVNRLVKPSFLILGVRFISCVLKTAEVGYTLPTKISNKVMLHTVLFYASGNYLSVWSKFKLWDSEMAGDGLSYSLQHIINIGGISSNQTINIGEFLGVVKAVKYIIETGCTPKTYKSADTIFPDEGQFIMPIQNSPDGEFIALEERDDYVYVGGIKTAGMSMDMGMPYISAPTRQRE